MSDEERVADVLALSDGWRWAELSENERARYRDKAAAAMRETRLIDAEALRVKRANEIGGAGFFIANWLTARAKENDDG